jgi:hypothetical protein
MNWCTQQNIGLTDLITNIQDADIHNQLHKDIILSVNDNAFDTFAHIIPTDIQSIINQNANSLCGVYLTRYEHTLLADGIISNLWTTVKETCNNLNIHCHDLVTPSRQFRTLTRIQKLDHWTNTIQICT